MSFVRNQPAKAIEYHKRAADADHQYINLKLISYWEMALANLALWDIHQSLECWVTLKAEGAVSLSSSQTKQSVDIAAVVESDLCLWCGGLYVASLWGKEGGNFRDLRRTPGVETGGCGNTDTYRGQLIT